MQPDTAYVKISDEALVQQWRRGNPDALERLIIKYKDRIYNAILRICADRDAAAELTQDVFVKVLENAPKFHGKSGFYTWCFRIAINTTLNYCRKQKRRQVVSLENVINDDNDYEQAKTTLRSYLVDEAAIEPATVIQDREQVELITAAINCLDDDQRAVLVLRDIEGMSYAQIASVLEIELGTVKSRLSRARANLREKLESILK